MILFKVQKLKGEVNYSDGERGRDTFGEEKREERREIVSCETCVALGPCDLGLRANVQV